MTTRRFLEFRDFAEMEIINLHRWDDHFERFLSRCAHGWTEHLDIRKHFEKTLIETEVSYAAADPAILDQKGSIARHAGENLFVRIDFADVPEPRDENYALGRADH